MDNNDIYYNIPEEDAPSGRVAKYMDLRVDWAFKYIFSIKEHLLKLLNDILPVDVYDLKYLPNAIPVRSDKDKFSSLDVICESSDGSFLCEMQRRPETDFDDRLAYYTSSRIARQPKRGDIVYKVNRVYVICIAGYIRKHSPNTPKDKVLFSYDFLENDTHEPYANSKISYYFLELARFRKKEWEELTGQPERWCYIFKKLRTFADGTPIPADLHGFEDVVGDAKLDGLSIDKQKDYAEAMLEDYIRYTETLAAREEGITEGETRGRAEVVRNMLAMGMNADVITKATGLSAEEVQALAAK